VRELALGLLLAAGVNAAFIPAARPPARGVPMRLSPETAVETAGLMSLGMRRMAADLELIRLLVYYGTPDEDIIAKQQEMEARGEHGEKLYGAGRYPELLARARRIVELDPKFSYAVLYGAGALAFNVGRPNEALDLLEDALKRDPDNAQYRAYIGAVGFQKSGDTNRVLAMLEPTLSRPDCPTMIKSMVAFMYKRLGRRAQAIRVYRDILDTTRDAGYRATAEHALVELGAAP
jgi:tetratricopeptide (TPR) repeat protein